MSLKALPGGRLGPPLAPRILLCAMDPELLSAVSRWIREAWPRAEIRVQDLSNPSNDDSADLRIHGSREPPASGGGDGPLNLWLGELDRTLSPRRLRPGLWLSPMPTTPAHLRQAIALCLAGAAC